MKSILYPLLWPVGLPCSGSGPGAGLVGRVDPRAVGTPLRQAFWPQAASPTLPVPRETPAELGRDP